MDKINLQTTELGPLDHFVETFVMLTILLWIISSLSNRTIYCRQK